MADAALIPHKRASMGFTLQSALHSAAASPAIRLPLFETASLPWQKNYSFFQYADSTYDLRHYYTTGAFAEGTLVIPWIPGLLLGAAGDGAVQGASPTPAANVSDIGEWMLARSNAANQHQGRWATLFLDTGHVTVKFPDVKCTGGTIEVSPGALAILRPNCTGITTPVDWDGDFGAASVPTTVPYKFQEALIGLAYTVNDDPPASETVSRDHRLEWNNMVEAAADMITLWGGVTPLYLPNAALAQWTGEFMRFHHNTASWNAFMGGTECTYMLRAARGGSGCEIYFPRILYTALSVDLPDSGVAQETPSSWQALGDASAGYGGAEAYHSFENRSYSA